jgi:hypothetical protein
MKTLGLVSFLYFGVGVAFMLYRWPADYTKTYSQNAARTRGSIIYYGALVLTFLVMFSAFVYGWLIPTLHLPRVFTAAFTIGVVAQAVAGIVPETHGWKVRTHVNAAYVMYYSTVVTVGALALSVGAPASLLIGGCIACDGNCGGGWDFFCKATLASRGLTDHSFGCTGGGLPVRYLCELISKRWKQGILRYLRLTKSGPTSTGLFARKRTRRHTRDQSWA